MAYEDNIEHQLRMLDITWEAFIDHGVNENTELILEFVYLASNKKAAISLNAALTDYNSNIRSEGFLKKKWFVDGCSRPTTVSKSALAQWLEHMVALGWEYDCEFDGFGASMPPQLPKFTYFPDPVKAGSINASDKICECCEQQRGYIYTGTMYSRANVEAICPWCIHDGSASEKYDGAFNCLPHGVDELDDSCDLPRDVAIEVSCRTPGFATFQEEEWQLHCNDGCEFHGLATIGDFQKISKKESERLKRVTYLDDSELEDLKEGNPATELDYFFKFKCRHCGEIRFMMDLD